MTFEEINEPVEVISYFDGQRMRPLRFRWRDRAYKVMHVNGVWSDIKGRSKIYHFHVATKDSGSFELVYDNTGFKWTLGKVCID
ncbi:hypothetical protein JW935_15665 [candidate division KSB1 bacterium]|nr:hypothetical protein [candidate division KSB1 bacterium]